MDSSTMWAMMNKRIIKNNKNSNTLVTIKSRCLVGKLRKQDSVMLKLNGPMSLVTKNFDQESLLQQWLEVKDLPKNLIRATIKKTL